MSEKTEQKYDVPYMERTRDFYRAQGYDKDYQWASFDDVPFQRLDKALSECTACVITTAMPDTAEGRAKRQVYSCPSEPVPDSMYTAELSWHKNVTHTDDVASFLPLAQLEQAALSKRIAQLSERFHCVPTEYSQRNTREKDAPEVLARCQADAIDIAILVPL